MRGATRRRASLAPRRVPIQSRARRRVDRILDAAAELLAERPVSELTTAAIAARAGVPIGSLYQYFPNKLAVLAALARRVMDKVDAATERAVHGARGLPWRQALNRAVAVNMESFARQPGYAALLRAIRGTPEFREITDRSNARVARLVASHPEVRSLGISEHRAELVARTAIEAANALQDRALVAETPERAREIVREMETLLAAYLGHYRRRSRRG